MKNGKGMDLRNAGNGTGGARSGGRGPGPKAERKRIEAAGIRDFQQIRDECVAAGLRPARSGQRPEPTQIRPHTIKYYLDLAFFFP